MKILYTAFYGNKNSSKVLLDHVRVDEKDKLYLRNSFTTCVNQFYKKVARHNYDLILSFGQGDKNLNHIKIESIGRCDKETLATNYNYNTIIKRLEKQMINYSISENAGNYLCNHIYYSGLKYIKEKNKKTKMLFIHIPPLEHIPDIQTIAELFVGL